MISEIAEWEAFYLIVGTAAGALIGLQFVVLTLLDQKPLHKGAAETAAVFIAPTIIYFSVTLLISAIIMAPWQEFVIPSVIFSLLGVCGVVYIGTVALRMRKETAYLPQRNDWIYRITLPLFGFLILVSSSFVGVVHLYEMLFGIGIASLILLFVGIHNAWDNIAYTVFFQNAEQE